MQNQKLLCNVYCIQQYADVKSFEINFLKVWGILKQYSAYFHIVYDYCQIHCTDYYWCFLIFQNVQIAVNKNQI